MSVKRERAKNIIYTYYIRILNNIVWKMLPSIKNVNMTSCYEEQQKKPCLFEDSPSYIIFAGRFKISGIYIQYNCTDTLKYIIYCIINIVRYVSILVFGRYKIHSTYCILWFKYKFTADIGRYKMHTTYILHTVNRILQNSKLFSNLLLFCKIRFTVCSM